jgi:hypothetical protein
MQMTSKQTGRKMREHCHHLHGWNINVLQVKMALWLLPPDTMPSALSDRQPLSDIQTLLTVPTD